MKGIEAFNSHSTALRTSPRYGKRCPRDTRGHSKPETGSRRHSSHEQSTFQSPAAAAWLSPRARRVNHRFVFRKACAGPAIRSGAVNPAGFSAGYVFEVFEHSRKRYARKNPQYVRAFYRVGPFRTLTRRRRAARFVAASAPRFAHQRLRAGSLMRVMRASDVG